VYEGKYQGPIGMDEDQIIKQANGTLIEKKRTREEEEEEGMSKKPALESKGV
jgi:hypothetical protein